MIKEMDSHITVWFSYLLIIQNGHPKVFESVSPKEEKILVYSKVHIEAFKKVSKMWDNPKYASTVHLQ